MLLQALQFSPVLKRILDRAGCTLQTLWKRAKEVEPKLGYSGRNIKRALKEQVYKERKNLAWTMIHEPKNRYLHRVYVDEASLSPLLKGGKCITTLGQHPPEPQTRWNTLNESLHYLVAVHPLQGLVHFELLSSSKCHEEHGTYVVSILQSYNVLFVIRQAIRNE